jgi:hypothetical protein
MALCRLCRVYATQLAAVCGICHEAGAHSDKAPVAMSEERKQRILDALSKDTG